MLDNIGHLKSIIVRIRAAAASETRNSIGHTSRNSATRHARVQINSNLGRPVSAAIEEDIMKAIAYLAAITTVATFGIAAAQTSTQTKTRDFTVKLGATVQIGIYYQLNTKTCQAGPIPKVVQTSKPAIGKLIIEEKKVEPSQKQCHGFLIPANVVRFEAGDKAGKETITYEVVYQSRKLGTQKTENTITVQ
jgi:hypothetical protein